MCKQIAFPFPLTPLPSSGRLRSSYSSPRLKVFITRSLILMMLHSWHVFVRPRVVVSACFSVPGANRSFAVCRHACTLAEELCSCYNVFP